MKKHYLLLLMLTCASTIMHAQVFTKKTMYAGETIASKSTYLFPAFTNAVVKLKNGGTLNSTMNFNLLICEMQFIDPAKDTLILEKLEDINSIIFDSSTFFFDKGYYQIIASSDAVKLAVLRKASFAPVKIGALGLPNHNGNGVQSYNSVSTSAGSKDLVMNEDVEITNETAFFLIRHNNEMVKVNKAGFMKTFPSKEAGIQAYLKQNKTDLDKEIDLKKLFAYCITL